MRMQNNNEFSMSYEFINNEWIFYKYYDILI